MGLTVYGKRQFAGLWRAAEKFLASRVFGLINMLVPRLLQKCGEGGVVSNRYQEARKNTSLGRTMISIVTQPNP